MHFNVLIRWKAIFSRVENGEKRCGKKKLRCSKSVKARQTASLMHFNESRRIVYIQQPVFNGVSLFRQLFPSFIFRLRDGSVHSRRLFSFKSPFAVLAHKFHRLAFETLFPLFASNNGFLKRTRRLPLHPKSTRNSVHSVR